MNKEQYDSVLEQLSAMLARDLRSKRGKFEFNETMYILAAVEEKYKREQYRLE